MTMFNHTVTRLCRPLFILISCVFLNACGGGESLSLANGIGGTGITAVGRITAFGSVYINGIHFNTDHAKFILNDKEAQQDDLLLGNIIQVKGKINPDKKTGVADEVIYSDTLTGPITQKANGKAIEIMKQSVLADDLTLFHGFKKLAALDVGNIVEVSGFSSADGNIKASSIRLIDENYADGSELELEGHISDIDQSLQTFKIQDLTVNYAQSLFTGTSAEMLKDDMYLIVTSNQSLVNDTFIATSIVLDEQLLSNGDHYEIEGLITQVISQAEFFIDDIPVITTSETTFNSSISTLKSDDSVRILGTANTQGELLAETITVLAPYNEVILEATLESIDLENQRITILGQTGEINTSTLLLDDRDTDSRGLTLEDFSVGESVFMVLWKNGSDQFIVARLSKTEPLEDTMIIGLPTAANVDLSTLTLFNQVVNTGSAQYFDAQQNTISHTKFFSIADNLLTDVMVTGQVSANGTIEATTLELLD